MPVTRSQTKSEQPCKQSNTVATDTVTTVTTTSAPGTTATEASVTTAEGTVKSVPTARRHQDSTCALEGTCVTLPVKVNPLSPSSVRSSQLSAKRKKQAEARVELARKRLQEAEAAAALAKAQLELLQLDSDEDDIRSEIEDHDDRDVNTKQWVDSTVEKMYEKEEHPGGPVKTKEIRETSNGRTGQGNSELADAILKAIDTRSAHPPTSSTMYELPYFDGNCGEWIAFKTVYEETAPFFSKVMNMARLRKSVKGAAREAVKSVLYSDCSPEEVVEALRRRFGRPDALVLGELEKLKLMPRITDNARDLCVFASQVNNTVATVRGLKKPQYLHAPEMVKIIVDKMPAVLRYRWYDFAAEEDNEDPDLILMAKFFNREADRCGPYASQEAVLKKSPQRQTAHALQKEDNKKTFAKTEKPTCPHCQNNHHLHECRTFLQASTNERWDIAKQSKICFKCLQNRHRKDNCRKPACKVCHRWHHTLLHADKQEAENKTEERKEVTNNVMLPVNSAKTATAYLKMIPVEVFGPKGSAKVMALLDEGSTVTLLDSRIVQQIGVQGPQDPLTLETVGGKLIRKKDSMKINLKIKGIHQPKKRNLIGARTIDDINLSAQKLDRHRIEECAHLRQMVEQLYYEEEAPRLLIGQDNWELIVSRSTRKGKKNQPVASLTYLGWVLHGSDGRGTKQVNFVKCAHLKTRDDELEDMIKEHFALESLGVQSRRPSSDADAKALAILEKTSRRLEDGRFEVGLIWKNENETMPENYEYAKNRLKNIERKLDKDTELKEEYEQQIKNLLDNGYAEEVKHESVSKRRWYLPHFAVTHPTKRKKRLVFDAAAKCGGKSLNDALLTGPDLLQSLFGVLLRFRQGPVAVVADIKEMFLQIRIQDVDRDSLRFLWRGDQRSGPPKEYRMTSVIFGAACSPSTAIYVKNKNALEYQDQYPEAASAVVRNHYMDDYLQSFNDEEEAVKIAMQVDGIHRQARFILRGWASNVPEVLRKLAQTEDSSKEIELGSKEEKTLGLLWFTGEDTLGFKTTLRNLKEEVTNKQKTPTKREATSAVMSTFDPMGLASPVLIQGKRLLQDIWKSGVGWDEEIQPKDEVTWKTYLENLQLLKELRIPRCVTYCNTEGELHIFTDASEMAYACAVYWRQKIEDGSYTVALLAGKARVSPLKPVSIPRLELQAALLGTRMAQSVEEELDLKIMRKTYWTDSSTVLSWIKTDPRTFKPFVAHRLAEIEDTSKPQQWRWVPSAQNPADDATRGIPKGFDKNHRWFTGPEFLRKEEYFWPEPRTSKAEVTGEEKQVHSVASMNTIERHSTPEPLRFSRWTRLWRATARILQFIDLCQRKKEAVNIFKKIEEDPAWKKLKNTQKVKPRTVKQKKTARTENMYIPLEPNQLERAEKILLQRSQEESFGEEISLMKKNKPLNKKSELRRLDVIEEDGLLRIHGRIDAAQGLEKNYRRPVVLDSKHHITKLLIIHYHEKFNHGNHATVMNEIRQRYWVLGLRSSVRALIHRCQWCRVYKSTPQLLPTGDLPRERLQIGEAPFTCAAVDYFGPMIVTVGRRHEKRWGALFTCLTTRAVHIELAASLSSDSMILALRRMAARRGMPKTIFSDNGTNFVKANKELKEELKVMKTEELVTKAEEEGVRWKFIPPGAPNMGGAWERLVKSIKTALAVTLKERYPKEEVLHTLLLEAEHIINSRPLVVTEENMEEEALTPNHFLIGRSCAAPRIGSFIDADLKQKRTWKIAQRLADHFWSRWVKEYLPTLLPRKMDKRAAARNIQYGDTVLIVDSTLPRCSWPRGQVVRTYPGPDGRTRVLDIRTAGGVLRRPCSKVVILVSKESPSPEFGATSAAHEGEDVGD